MTVLFNPYVDPAEGYAPISRPPQRSGGLPDMGGLLRSLLPSGLDTGDLLLLAVLFFLYRESGDEDYLIMLAVVALSIFSGK